MLVNIMLYQKYLGLELWVWFVVIFIVLFSSCQTTNSFKKLYASCDTEPKNKINIDTFSQKYQINVLNFNTSWCGWSKKFQPEWDKFSNNVKQNPELYHVNAIDVKCDNEINNTLCNKYNIPGYPHVIIEYNNKQIPYNGRRTADDLINYIKTL
jgi:thiol-disulfide isomerase/thioredoxin